MRPLGSLNFRNEWLVFLEGRGYRIHEINPKRREIAYSYYFKRGLVGKLTRRLQSVAADRIFTANEIEDVLHRYRRELPEPRVAKITANISPLMAVLVLVGKAEVRRKRNRHLYRLTTA